MRRFRPHPEAPTASCGGVGPFNHTPKRHAKLALEPWWRSNRGVPAGQYLPRSAASANENRPDPQKIAAWQRSSTPSGSNAIDWKFTIRHGAQQARPRYIPSQPPSQ